MRRLSRRPSAVLLSTSGFEAPYETRVNPSRIDALLAHQIARHALGAALSERVVIVRVADAVGVPGDDVHPPVRGCLRVAPLVHLLEEAVDLALRRFRQTGGVEGERRSLLHAEDELVLETQVIESRERSIGFGVGRVDTLVDVPELRVHRVQLFRHPVSRR